jgi:HlyD family secretion protein
MTSQPWSARGPALLGLVMLGVLIGGVGGWSVLTPIAGAVVASGQIEVEQNRQIVQHPDGGVVEWIAVTEGQAVAAGDLLVRLDGSALRTELAIVEAQLVEILARQARLEAERDDAAQVALSPLLLGMAADRPDLAPVIDGQVRLFEARRDTLARQAEQLHRRLAQITAQNHGIAAQMHALTTQLALVAEDRTAQQALLVLGLTQASRLRALQRTEAEIEGQIGALTATLAQNDERAAEIDLEILRLAAQRREDAGTQLRDIGQAELEWAERQRALSRRLAHLDIQAPVSGRVLGLQVTTPRAVLRPAEPVLHLVPQDRPLVVAVQIDPVHIDNLRVGQDVRIALPALPARITPELWGKVTVVSADALPREGTGQSYFRAEITLNPGEMERLGGVALLPGMPVETFIQTTSRTPLAYLMQPFTDYFRRAFRET